MQRLTFAGGQLEDDDTISFYKIVDKSVLHLKQRRVHKVPFPEIIVTKTTTGKVYALRVKLTDSIKMVKHNIVEQLNIPPDSQAVLILCGTELEDEHTISEYEIYDKTPIYMMLKVSSPKIIVKTLSEKYFTLQVTRSDSIRVVKQKIEVQEGIFLTSNS